MESIINSVYLVIGIIALICSAIIFLFNKIYKLGADKTKAKADQKDILDAIELLKHQWQKDISNLQNDIRSEVSLETNKIKNDWDKWQIKQESNNLSQQKEISDLQERHRKIEDKFEATLNQIWTELSTINKTITKLVTIQEQEVNNQPTLQRGRPRGK